MTATIFALSSGALPSAIAVMRLSGPGAVAAATALAGRLPAARRAGLRTLRDPEGGDAIDRALVLVFPGPDTATGEDLVEFHLHGSRAVVRRMTDILSAQPGLRAAEAGEFTRRALAAGRIDLTEAEGLADLLAAETEGQRRAALRVADGHLRQRIEAWTDRLLDLSAAIEAAIDHSDEPDAADEAAIRAHVQAGARALADDIGTLLAQPPAERLRDGLRVVLAGPPNSGKSTLFNRMVGRDAAIVSPIAGTTRDRIEAPVVRNGIAWLVTDTAGLATATDDPIEAIGIARARESLAVADVILWLGDGPAETAADRTLMLHPRGDMPGRRAVPEGRIAVSAEPDGDGTLWNALVAQAEWMLPTGDAIILNSRQHSFCCDARLFLCDAANGEDDLLIAEFLRLARQCFDRLTGRAGMEHVFDTLFGRFCIGK